MCGLFWGAHKSLAPRARTLLGGLGQATLSFFAVATLSFVFFGECPKFCDLAKQRRKIVGGVSEVGGCGGGGGSGRQGHGGDRRIRQIEEAAGSLMRGKEALKALQHERSAPQVIRIKTGLWDTGGLSSENQWNPIEEGIYGAKGGSEGAKATEFSQC